MPTSSPKGEHRCKGGDRMVSISTLFNCAAADVTLERVRDLVSQAEPEGLTLEYKRGPTPKIALSVAAMANTYGGIILVGITDGTSGDRLVGISERDMTAVASSIYDSLEPPWEPELIPVQLEDKDGRYVLVIRVDHTVAPRPVLIKGAAWIRLQGRNSIADRSRLQELFTETPFTTRPESNLVSPINIQERRPDGSVEYDFVMRTGLVLPLGDSAKWRPFSEQVIDSLLEVLEASLLRVLPEPWPKQFSLKWDQFERYGFNRSRNAKAALKFKGPGSNVSLIESIVEVKAPELYGVVPGTLLFTLDIIGRIREYQAAAGCEQGDSESWRLQIGDLQAILKGLITLTGNPGVVSCLAKLAGIDPVRVGQLRKVDFQTGLPVTELLDTRGLELIPDSVLSRGTGGMFVDPSLDLNDPFERHEQIDCWLNQLALDAGLLGMERVLAQMKPREAGN